MPSKPFTYEAWQRRRSSVSFLEPILRFGDVAVIGITGGVTLIAAGSPGGILFDFASRIWRAEDGEDVAVSGALAQVTLTVWALIISLGGAVYMEAARTIRTDSRANASALNAGRPFRRSTRMSRKTPPELLGQLVTIALDTPPVNPGKKLTVSSAPRTLVENYATVLDYWNRRAGFSAGVKSGWTCMELKRARKDARKVILLRSIASIIAILATFFYLVGSVQSLAAPLLVFLSVVIWRMGRMTLLDRSW